MKITMMSTIYKPGCTNISPKTKMGKYYIEKKKSSNK